MKRREIAALLRERAQHYPEGAARTEVVTVLRVGSFVIRCFGTREAVLRVAAKYESPRTMHSPAFQRLGKHSLRRPPDADAILQRLLDEEILS